MSTLVSSIIDESQALANRVDPAQRDRARAACDRAVRHWSERIPWPGLERRETFFADGSRFMTFPVRVRTIIRIGDPANRIALQAGKHWDRNIPELAFQDVADSTPWEFRDHGIVPTIAAPSTDTTLTIESTISESQTVYIRGLARDTTVSGTPLELYELQENFTITGTGATQTTNEFVRIDSIEKSNLAGSADIIISANADGNPLARIPAEERFPSYKRIEFLKTPTAGKAFQVDYYLLPGRIVDESVQIPPNIDREFMVWRVVGDLHWINQEPEAAALAWRKADGILTAQIHSQMAHGDNLNQAVPDSWALDDISDISSWGF